MKFDLDKILNRIGDFKNSLLGNLFFFILGGIFLAIVAVVVQDRHDLETHVTMEEDREFERFAQGYFINDARTLPVLFGENVDLYTIIENYSNGHINGSSFQLVIDDYL